MTTLKREDLIRALPYARRYARALTGSQPRGDQLVADSLTMILNSTTSAGDAPTPDSLMPDAPLPDAPMPDALMPDARASLYAATTRAFAREPAGSNAFIVGGLSQPQRQLLLLTSLEDLTVRQAAQVIGLNEADADLMLAGARDSLRAAVATDVLIIEDEPIIAMDLEQLVAGCGHRVVGVATTEAQAVELAQQHKPGLILADINLGLGGDGTSAVARILSSHYAPVIFVTAYPERLLRGEALEPAFVITKPFEPLTLAIATYQAVSGGTSRDPSGAGDRS